MTKTKVSWLAWSEESFKKARQLDKPILLGISAVWCHWCHVMDQTTYSNSEVARLIEEKFVPIRVDRDQRPDIDKLADIIIEISGKKVTKRYNLNAPQGVRGRNADLTLMKKVLGWQPQVSLEDGMERTYRRRWRRHAQIRL